MSMLAAETLDPRLLFWMIPTLGLALLIAALGRVLQPASVLGPQRLSPDEPPHPLFAAFLLGVAVWLGAQITYLSIRQSNLPPGAQPPPLTATETASLSTLGPLLGLAVVLLADYLLAPSLVPRLGLTPRLIPAGLLAGLIAIVIVMPLMFWVGVATEQFWQLIHYEHATEHPLLTLMKDNPSATIQALVIFSAVVLAPCFEELLFRAHLQTLLVAELTRWRRNLLRARGGGGALPDPSPQSTSPDLSIPVRWLAIAIASLPFAMVHPRGSGPQIFIFSLCLGYLYERTANLYSAISLHALFNALQIAQFYYLYLRP